MAAQHTQPVQPLPLDPEAEQVEFSDSELEGHRDDSGFSAGVPADPELSAVPNRARRHPAASASQPARAEPPEALPAWTLAPRQEGEQAPRYYLPEFKLGDIDAIQDLADEEDRHYVVGILVALQKITSKYHIPTRALESILCLLPFVADMAGQREKFPKLSLYQYRQALCLDQHSFETRAMCPLCAKIFSIDRARSLSDGFQCDYEHLPKSGSTSSRDQDEPEGKRGTRERCKGVVLDPASHQPVSPFPVRPLVDRLAELFARPDFLQDVQSWRLTARDSNGRYWGDLHDGSMWQEFQSIGGRAFLANSDPAAISLCLSMNCDEFNPYGWATAKLGAFQFTIANLPRHLREHPDYRILWR